MIIQHYGTTVDSEVPTTGVFTNNRVDYLLDDLTDCVDLAYESALEDYVGERLKKINEILSSSIYDEAGLDNLAKAVNLLEEVINPNLDCIDTLDWLIGFKKVTDKEEAWHWFESLQYGYAPDEEAECSVMVGEIYSQVVRSRWGLKGALCSPCYPGQVDVDSNGEFIGFSYPPHYFEEDDPIYGKIFLLEVKE
jgi:hypothetical protein